LRKLEGRKLEAEVEEVRMAGGTACPTEKLKTVVA
jgi:hypothetical protein